MFAERRLGRGGQAVGRQLKNDRRFRSAAARPELIHRRMEIESVLIDREARHASTNTQEFESLPPKGVGLSSIVLVKRADPLTEVPEENDPFLFHDYKLVPALDGVLKATPQPLLYFVVYPDKSIPEKTRIRVQYFVGGEELQQKQSELPVPDAGGAIPMLVNAEGRPGKCEIKVTAIQGYESATRSVSYTIAAP